MNMCEFGIIIDGDKYLPLSISSLLLNEAKNKSLHDTIYSILRDIFRNSDRSNVCNQVSEFNDRLMKGIPCDENPDTFDYSDALYDKIYMENLVKWLDAFNESYLCRFEEGDKSMIDMTGYIEFDEWWSAFEEMKRQVKEQYQKL